MAATHPGGGTLHFLPIGSDEGAGLPALMAGAAVAAAERGAAGGECGWMWGGGCGARSGLAGARLGMSGLF